MLIEHKAENNKGVFFIGKEGSRIAELIYSQPDGGTMILEHTEVDDELRGQNVGYQLVEASVEYAREHNIKLIVWCPFAKKVFDKKPDWHDVLD